MNNATSLQTFNKTLKDLITENYDKDFKKCRDVVFSILKEKYHITNKDTYILHTINRKFLLIYVNFKPKPKLYLIKS